MLEKKTKALVPVLLNGRMCTWIYDIGDPEITIQIAMRHYVDSGFIPQILDVHFIRRRRIIPAILESRLAPGCKVSGISTGEVYYTCEHPNVRFESESIPVIK